MIYKYRAKKGPAELVEGTVEAQSEPEAIEKVSQLGFFPLAVEVQKQGGQAAHSSVRLRGRVRSQEITIFTRQLASLLKSGVPILQSLNIIGEQSENAVLKQVIRSVHNSIKEGDFFSSSLAKFPQFFSPLYVAMVNAGEGGGSLPEALLRIAEYRAQEEELLSKFRAALAYPVLMVFVGIGTIIFMLTFVIPRLTGILVGMGQDLPLPTQILISVSKTLSTWWLWAVLALVVLTARRQMRLASSRLPVSRLKLKIPAVGPFIQKAELARFCRTLEILIRNGIPILRALQISIPVVGNEAIKSQLAASYKELEQGGSFGRSIRNSVLFPAFMSNLIIVGEESGRLVEALGEVAVIYERDTDQAMKTLVSLLEPVMILGMGLVVGFIVVAMLLPIFEINVMAR